MSNRLGTWTLFKRENKRFMKVWLQTIFAPVVSNLLFLTVFGLSLHRNSGDVLEGVSNLQFIVPGLIIMGLINNAYQNPSSSIIIMKFQQLIQDLMIIPLKKIEIFIAFIGSAVLRAFIVGGVTYLTSLFFVDFPYHSVSLILLTSLLVSLFFSFLGMILGIWADVFDKQAFVQNFVLMPLIFLGGVFYPITSLPGIFQKISQANPIVYMIDLLRYGFTGVHEFSITLSLTILTAGVLILGTTNYLILRSGWKLHS
ncbi:MAG: ABC transporter permease [Patescibacteria group bacterium]